MAHTVQNWPRSDLVGLVRVWPNASGLEASWCAGIIGPGFWQGITDLLPVSHFQTQLHAFTDIPDHIVQNQPRPNLVLGDSVKFGPNGSGLEASQHARIIWPVSGQCFWADPNQIRHVYWENTQRNRISSALVSDRLGSRVSFHAFHILFKMYTLQRCPNPNRSTYTFCLIVNPLPLCHLAFGGVQFISKTLYFTDSSIVGVGVGRDLLV